MAETTGISWCDATFNPWWGCTKVSPACDSCYAERDAKRYGFDIWGPGKERRYFGDKHWNEPRKWNAKAAKEGKRLRVFCASMADVFDNEVDQVHRDRLWQLIKETPNLDWLIVTKRIGNARTMLPADWGDGYANVWLIITVIDQAEADRDVPKLLTTPARVRGLSIEPQLGAVDLTQILIPGRWGRGRKSLLNALTGELHDATTGCIVSDGQALDWVICGGESGPKARPVHPDWIRSLRDQCQAAEVAFHFKQWGEWHPNDHAIKGDTGHTRVGKKKAGHLLDGREWREFPI